MIVLVVHAPGLTGLGYDFDFLLHNLFNFSPKYFTKNNLEK